MLILARIYDFNAYKKERDLVALEAECADFKHFFTAYMNQIYSDDDGINAQIEFELIPDDEL